MSKPLLQEDNAREVQRQLSLALQEKIKILEHLQTKLDTPNISQKLKAEADVRETERQIWTLKGVLIHKLRLCDLQEIEEKYRFIDKVPKDYHYPELFIQEEKK